MSCISAATNQFVMSRRERQIQDTPLSAKWPPHHFWLRSPQEFECAQVFASMCHECSSKEPLDVTEDTAQQCIDKMADMIAMHQSLDRWKYLAGLRVEIQRWGSIWGGVTCWPESLEVMFSEACRTGQDSAISD